MGSEIANFITFQSPMVVISRYLGLSDAGAYSAANRFASIPNQVVLSAVMPIAARLRRLAARFVHPSSHSAPRAAPVTAAAERSPLGNDPHISKG